MDEVSPLEVANSADWLTEEQVIAMTDINPRTFERYRGSQWRDAAGHFLGGGLLPKPRVIHLKGFALGTLPGRYPPTIIELIRRLNKLRQKYPRDLEKWIWRLFPDGFAVDIRIWADDRLAAAEQQLAPIRDDRDLETIVAGIPDPRRGDPHWPIYRPFAGIPEQEHYPKSLMHWALGVATGIDVALSLYDPTPPLIRILQTVAGRLDKMPPPDDDLYVEQMSIPHFRKILTSAKNQQMEQVRADFQVIIGLAEGRNVWDDLLQKKLNRHERRAWEKRQLPPLPPELDYLIACSRDFMTRAVLLPFLIYVRSSPDHSKNLSRNLAMAALRAARASSNRRLEEDSVADDTDDTQ